MAISKEKKESLVEQYAGMLQESQAVVLVRSQGLTVAEVTDLRNRIREAGGKYAVIKNTLFRRALSQADLPVPSMLSGPVAATFCPDDIASVVKVVDDYAKTMEGRDFAIIGGIVEGQELNRDRATALASLPSKEVLFAQILAGINAPATQMAGILTSAIRQVLSVMQARVDQLGEGEAAA